MSVVFSPFGGRVDRKATMVMQFSPRGPPGMGCMVSPSRPGVRCLGTRRNTVIHFCPNPRGALDLVVILPKMLAPVGQGLFD